MKAFLRVVSVFVLGLVMAGNASAYYLDGGIIRNNAGTDSGDYLGYLGDVDVGLPAGYVAGPNWIGTDITVIDPAGDLSSTGNYTLNPNYVGFGLGDQTVVQWFRFSSSQLASLSAFFELGSYVDLGNFKINFFQGTDETATAGQQSGSGHLYLYDFGNFPVDEVWWMRVEGNATAVGKDSGYKVRLFTTAVPLPPAILLFGSALAGFGVLGCKKRQNISA